METSKKKKYDNYQLFEYLVFEELREAGVEIHLSSDSERNLGDIYSRYMQGLLTEHGAVKEAFDYMEGEAIFWSDGWI